MTTVYIDAIGLMAPGLMGWQNSIPILNGTAAYQKKDMPRIQSTLLSANERRRTTQLIKLALHVASEAMESCHNEVHKIAAIFASSEGDTEILDKNCTALALATKPISPTNFHNSVHNAPAGYWAIAGKYILPSTSIAAYEATFSAGLLESFAYAEVEQQSVLYVAYDNIAPAPLKNAVKVDEPFATALLLSPKQTKFSHSKLELKLSTHAVPGYMDTPELEALRTTNSAAHSLPLLSAIAKKSTTKIALPYLTDSQLVISCSSC